MTTETTKRLTVAEYLESLKYDERTAFCAKLETWLSMYTDEVFTYVFENALDDLVNDPTALKLLDTLYTREQEAQKSRQNYIRDVIKDPQFWTSNGRTLHNSVFEGPSPYRRVLYDLFIRPSHEKKEDPENA